MNRVDLALAAWDRGWWLTPLNGKIPVHKGWTELPRAPRDLVAEWAEQGNLGVLTGVVARADGRTLVVVDIDPGAPAEFLSAPQRIQTLWARTPRGGFHGYFWAPPGLRNSASKIAPHVDVRARGGQVVLPNGDGYTWITDHEPADIPPEWLGGLGLAALRVAGAPVGARNDTLNREAWMQRAAIQAGLVTADEVVDVLGQASTLPPGETARTLVSALRAPAPVAGPVLAPGVHAGGVSQSVEQFVIDVFATVPPDRLYLRGSELGEIVGARWTPVTSARLRGIIDVEVKYLKQVKEKITEEVSKLSRDQAELLIANATMSQDVRRLHAVCAHPVVRPDLTVLGPGWHFMPSGDGILVTECEVADEPIPLWDVCSDFPMDEHSKANLLALLFTVLVRPTLDAPAPLFVVTAAQERTGKTKLVNDVIGGILLGRGVPSDTWPSDPDEVRKLLHSAAIGGTELYLIDNVPAKLDSPQLASVLTATDIIGRLLGKSAVVEAPNNCTVIATGNHTRCSAELAKRALVIALDAQSEAPEMRSNFRHRDLAAAVLERRAGILRWLLDMVEQAASDSSLILGGFERWALTIGRILHAWPVLADRSTRVAEMVDDEAPLELLIAGWDAGIGDEEVGIAEVMAVVEALGWGGEALDPVRSSRSRSTALGRMLHRLAGRVINGQRIERRTLRGMTRYRLVRV